MSVKVFDKDNLIKDIIMTINLYNADCNPKHS